MTDEELILNRFFTNTDKPIFALKNMPPAIQSYLYMGVSRFPNMRKRFLKFVKDKCDFDGLVEKLREGENIRKELKPLEKFAAKQNAKIFFDFGHKSTGEGSTVFVVSENNPIYATEIQQDFYFPMTTMELSTRYSRSFSKDRIYWDPELMDTGFAEEAREVVRRNFELYNKGFDVLKEEFKEKQKKSELPEKVSILDSLRALIPIAAHTTVILGGNSRAVMEHLKKLLTYKDNFIQEYTEQALKELSTIMPEYFERVKADKGVIRRERKLREKTDELFGDKFIPSEEGVTLHYDVPLEEMVLGQILYPYCHLTFGRLVEEVGKMNEKEREEILQLATEDRKNRKNPIRGFAAQPLVFEIEAPWRLWKDFKRNRMNLRFHQEMRGKSGYEIPELLKKSRMRKDYEEAMKDTSDLIERVYQKYGGRLSKTVAAQGSKKRFLLCMHPRQLTVLGELRTSGEGDKGYRKIASEMIQLAIEKNEKLFSHINDNYRG